jgi:hypothetical protein
VLLIHLIKWRYQPELRCGNWRGSIDEARTRIDDILEDSPSLHNVPAERLERTWHHATARTTRETGPLHMPKTFRWTIAQILDKDFLPN